MLEALNEAFCKLPGVGAKTAQRYIYHFLEKDKQSGINLANVLLNAMNNIKQCSQCHYLTQHNLCHICNSDKRDNSKLCIVEASSDIDIIEQTQVYNGLYFALNGYLSPIDNIGVAEIGINDLEDILKNSAISEIILATNATIEGEITANYINNIAKKYHIKTSQIAHGIPLGGELEYTDINTIAHAISGRKNL